jgi:hypothetical protein
MTFPFVTEVVVGPLTPSPVALDSGLAGTGAHEHGSAENHDEL